MTDQELLELAAKGAGIDIAPCTCSDARWPFKHHEEKSGKYRHWNPLVDDGDALRLAARLRMCIDIRSEHTEVTPPGDFSPESEEHENDPCAATRRAIVRAAAEIGKGMK